MKTQTAVIDFILKEWLVITSGVALLLTAVYTKQFPTYSLHEVQLLFILFVLFVAVNGLQQSGLILKIAHSIEKGKAIPLKLVLTTFLLSALLSNDVALIVIVPLTLSLNINRKDILVILEVLAANSGSALTPIGNPQNLFIYWFYDIPPEIFIKTIAPFSLVLLGLLIIASLFVKLENHCQARQTREINKKSYIYVFLLMIVFLTVFHVLAVSTGAVVILFALICDRKALHIDYALLVTFLFFFGIADNLKLMLASEINHSGHVFLLSSLASQLISNVPATLLFAKFTLNWQALLWGVNAGGFGSLFASLANLIAYKIYITHEETTHTAMFTAKFLIIGYLALFVSMGLYFLLYQIDVL